VIHVTRVFCDTRLEIHIWRVSCRRKLLRRMLSQADLLQPGSGSTSSIRLMASILTRQLAFRGAATKAQSMARGWACWSSSVMRMRLLSRCESLLDPSFPTS
jgi:hypothetical protein